MNSNWTKIGSIRRLPLAVLTLLVCGLWPATVDAQERTDEVGCWITASGRPDVDVIMAHYLEEFPHHERRPRTGGSTCLNRIFLAWPSNAGTVMAPLDRLEALAVETDDVFIRRGATASLIGAGKIGIPGVFDRLMRVYDSGGPTRRSVIAGSLPNLPDTARSVAFLRKLAVQAGPEKDFHLVAVVGVGRLSQLGEPGRAALRELAERNLVRDPEARMELRRLEARDFMPKPPGRPPGGGPPR